jgi:hypothetical protein
MWPAFPPTYAFAFENVRDKVPFMTMEPGEPHNVHVHCALHLPASRVRDFTNKVWEWVEELTGGITDERAIHLTTIDGALAGYLIKGTTKPWAERYGYGRTAQPQCIIYGRRADTSRNLGPSARRALDRQRGIRRAMPTRRHRSPVVGAPPAS